MKGISNLIDSDVEDSHDVLNSILSTSSEDTALTKPTQAKKTKKRHRVTMPKPKARVAKSSPPAKKAASKKTTAAKRKAVEEHLDEAEEVQETQQPKPRGRAAVAKPKEPKVKTVVQEDVDETMEVDQSPAAATSYFAPSKSSKTAPKVVPAESSTRPTKKTKPTVKKTMEVSHPAVEEEDSQDENMDTVEQSRPKNISRQNSRMRQEPGYRRRAGSASDTERGDPNLRRKLGDVTRKFENIDLKYRNLKEVGIGEANANMEKLRKQCEATTLASNNLIASLKQELAAQAPLVQDARKLKKQMQTQESEVSKLRTTTAELTSSLTSAQNEIKALQAKLAAARASSVAVEGRTPARDTKKDLRPAPLPVSEAAQVAQMKEELYSDLTGLIVRSVKRGDDGDTYDCIQTGRNGSKFANGWCMNMTDMEIALHFKLFVDAEEAKNASFEETDFLYTPLLDANRDRDMMELMPTYLTEEITFARQNAAKFYGRVLDTLTKRRVDE
jgi:hypothetical protein